MEGMTFRPFATDLFRSNNKCLVGEDGSEYTVMEALALLKGETDE